MPVTITFLFLYCFFSLIAFLVGAYTRNLVLVVVAGMMFLFIGLLGGALGYTEYIQSVNVTYTYTGGNLTSSSQTQNYAPVSSLVSQGTSLIFALAGVSMLLYAGGVYREIGQKAG